MSDMASAQRDSPRCFFELTTKSGNAQLSALFVRLPATRAPNCSTPQRGKHTCRSSRRSAVRSRCEEKHTGVVVQCSGGVHECAEGIVVNDLVACSCDRAVGVGNTRPTKTATPMASTFASWSRHTDCPLTSDVSVQLCRSALDTSGVAASSYPAEGWVSSGPEAGIGPEEDP